MGSKTKIVNGEEIVEFAKDADYSNKRIFKDALIATIIEVGAEIFKAFFERKK